MSATCVLASDFWKFSRSQQLPIFFLRRVLTVMNKEMMEVTQKRA